MFENLPFKNPEFFWLFLLLPALTAWYIWKYKKNNATLQISSIKGFMLHESLLAKLKPILFVLRLLAIALIIVALARPQTSSVSTKSSSTLGIDIVITIDISASMLAKDLRPDRLQALKKVAADFVRGRSSDRIGIVLYAAESYTKTPLTSDQAIILNNLQEVEYNEVLENGTAIGMGLATAVNRIKESKAKSKVIILMTDGSNNSGFIDPKIAADLAVEYGIKVYTIGIGTNGNALTPVSIRPDGRFQFAYSKVEIDEDLLKKIAKATGGKYYRATNNKKLEEIYEEIDKLEKTEIEEFKYYNYTELYRYLVGIAIVLLVLEFLLKQTVFRSFV